MFGQKLFPSTSGLKGIVVDTSKSSSIKMELFVETIHQ